MSEPGNYRVTVQVSDGYSLSDVYEATFTSHVITTQVQQPAYQVKILDDDRLIRYAGYMPPQINPEDHNAVKAIKRTVSGGYVISKLGIDYIRAKARWAKKTYIQ
jgi:hypothetical protein